jgi:hypothetical protein
VLIGAFIHRDEHLDPVITTTVHGVSIRQVITDDPAGEVGHTHNAGAARGWIRGGSAGSSPATMTSLARSVVTRCGVAPAGAAAGPRRGDRYPAGGIICGAAVDGDVAAKECRDHGGATLPRQARYPVAGRLQRRPPAA